MKASDIITDDIVSREKYKTRDVVGKKTTSQDYFGNRADKQKDRDLVSKEKSKESKKEWFEEGEDSCWKDYKQVGMKKKNGRNVPNCVPKKNVKESSWDKMGFVVRSDYTWPAMMLESANTREYNEFNDWISTKRDSQSIPKKESSGILAMILFTGEMIMVTYGPAKYIDQTDTHYILEISDGTHEYSKKNQIFFDSKNSFDKFITVLNLKFSSPNIKIKINNADVTETTKSVEEGWKQNLAGAALAGAAALGGGMAHAAPADASNAAIVKSLVNPQAQQRFAAQNSESSKEQHSQWLQNVKNAAEFDNPYQIIRTAINMAGVTPKEVLQNLPKGYKLPTTEPTGSYVPRGTPRTSGVDEGSMQAAAHKKSGPKFGGYYGATQKGPPKPGQGFGGAAESTGSKISIKGKK
jgi:hypothetical protein